MFSKCVFLGELPNHLLYCDFSGVKESVYAFCLKDTIRSTDTDESGPHEKCEYNIIWRLHLPILTWSKVSKTTSGHSNFAANNFPMLSLFKTVSSDHYIVYGGSR